MRPLAAQKETPTSTKNSRKAQSKGSRCDDWGLSSDDQGCFQSLMNKPYTSIRQGYTPVFIERSLTAVWLCTAIVHILL